LKAFFGEDFVEADETASPDGRSHVSKPVPARARPTAQKPSGRVSRKFVALSSAAILSVYSVGYVRTQTTGQALASSADAASASAQVFTGVTTATPSARVQRTPSRSATTTPTAPSRSVAAAATPTPAPSTPVQTGYRDGTYVGTGNSRHGSIEATVTISGGQIAATAITQCNTRYSCSRISRLLDAVVSAQGTKVNMVSGATDSSRAFLSAVSNALAQAT
jgi:uncharacterized protein with FMN-binding domain